jgi:type IV pilus assembly protein PilO
MKLGIREILFFIVMLGVLGSAYFFVFSKANDKRKALEADTLIKQRDLDNVHNATSGVNDRARKITELESAIKFFNSKLPAQREVDTILQQVAQTSQAAGLVTQTVKPSKSEANAHYSEEPIELTLTGSFEGFYQFLIDLEKLPRLTRVLQMKLSKINDHEGKMTAHLTLSIYFVPDTTGDGATAAAQ